MWQSKLRWLSTVTHGATEAVAEDRWAVVDFEGFALRRTYALAQPPLCSNVGVYRMRCRDAMIEVVGLSGEMQGLMAGWMREFQACGWSAKRRAGNGVVTASGCTATPGATKGR